jgi:16S rRNA processing protein RimM
LTPSDVQAAAEAALPTDAVEVGRVLGAWGIQGGIRVKPFAADPQALFSSKRWYLRPGERPRPPGSGRSLAMPLLLHVVQAREQGDAVVATARELPDRTAAEALQGARIFVSRASFPTPQADEFYWVDLIGLQVLNRQGQALGEVVGLLETGPHCVLRIQPPMVAATGGSQPAAPSAEVLVPFVSAYVDRVDLTGRQLLVDWSLDD